MKTVAPQALVVADRPPARAGGQAGGQAVSGQGRFTIGSKHALPSHEVARTPTAT